MRNFQLSHSLLLLCILLATIAQAQTVTKTYDPGFSTSFDGVGQYGGSMTPVSFASGDFSTGCLVTDVNVSITWAKTDGTCTSPGSGNSHHEETSFRLDAPNGTTVNLAPTSTWSGNADISKRTTVFDEASGSIASGTPANGTFNPSGNLNDFNGASAVGNWTLRVGDNGTGDPVCVESYFVEVTMGTALSSSITAQTNVLCHGASTGSLTAAGANGTAPYNYTWSNGATAATASGLAAGTYTVTVSDANNCPSSTSSATITQPASALTASAAVTSVIDCFNDTDGQVTASGSGGTTPYTFAWNTGGTAALETGLGAGTYSVTITDQNGCTDSTSVTMTQPAALGSSAAVTSALDCFNDTDGQITASGTGGTTPYTFAWNTGGTAALETGLGAGTYSVTITDQNGCTDSTSVTMTQPAALGSSAAVTSALDCFNDTDGQVTASGSGGTTPYTFAWNTGGTAALETGLGAGTYSVTITDQNGCTDSTSVTMTQPAALGSSAAVTSALDCFNDTDGQVTASGSGGTTPYTFAWNTGGTAALETGLGAGTYSVTITDQNGCTDSTSVTMTQPAALGSSAAVTSALDCFNDTDGQVTASGSGGTTPYTFAWNTGGTAALETSLGAGTYSVTITDQNGCTDSTSVTLTQPASLNASAAITSNYNGASISCNGSSDGESMAAATGGTGAYTYTWSNGASTSSITSLSAGTYSVTITDANGCTDSASVSLVEPTAIAASTSLISNATCGSSDGSASSSATGGTGVYFYSWSNAATTASISGVSAGTYSVTISDANGCVSSDSVTISSTASIVSSASVTSALNCNGDTDGQVTASATGGTTPYTYAWNTGGTAALETSLGAGTYSVTITDQNGCTDSTSVTLTQPSALSSSAAVTSALDCFNDTDGQVTASGTGGTTPYTYAWNTGGTAALETSLGAGTYSVTITDQNGCTDSTSVTLTQPAALAISSGITATLACNGDDDGQITAAVTGGTTPYTYAWSSGGTAVTANGLVTGTYSVTVTDQNGCTDSTSVLLTQPLPLVVSSAVTSTLDCNGDTDGQVTASGTGGTTPYTYAWNTGGTAALETGLGAGTYSVTITDQNGCTDSTSVTLTQPSALSSSAAVTSALDCFNDTDGQVTASATGGTTPYTYAWNTGGTAALETSLGAGTYSVTITDQNGCTDSTSVTLTQPSALSSSAAVTSALDCFNDTDGQVTASGTGGTTPYTYAWNTGGTAALETSLGAGTYSVTITDQNGCTDSTSVTLTQPAALAISSGITATLACNGDDDGQITAAVTGGTTPYTYAWSSGGTAVTANGLVTGTYSVTVTDQNGCTDSTSVLLTQPLPLVVSSAVTSTLDCNGDTDGQVTASGTGGTTPYTYAWNTGGTAALETGLGAGTYSVTITDQNGCTDSTSVTLTQPTALSLSAIETDVTCTGDADGEVNASVTGGTPTYTYLWSTGATTEDITALNGGTYTITVTDVNGCTEVVSKTVGEASVLLSLSSAPTDASCNGETDGTVNLTVTGGQPNFSYSWSNGSTNEDINSLGAGTYTVTVTDDYGCVKTTSATVTEPAVLDPGNVSTN